MAKYPLTDRQKNMIRSLAPGLRDGTVKSQWYVIRDRGDITNVKGIDRNGELWLKVWHEVKAADFDVFVNCGFLQPTSQGYTLNEYLILDAVEHDFEVNDWMRNGVSNTRIDLPLTPKQKTLLEALALDLQSPSSQIEAIWTMMLGDGGIASIHGLGNNSRLREIWNEVEPGDFTVFAKYGFFVELPSLQSYSLRLTLDKGLVLDAYKRGWKVASKEDSHITVNVHGNVSNSIITAASTLDNVQQSIGSSSTLNDDAKAQLIQLMGQLKEALANANLSEEDEEEADILARHAQTAIEQLNASKPNRKLFSLSVDGLEQAAKNIGRVAVPVATIAVQIVAILRPLLGS